VLKALSDERGGLSSRELEQVSQTLAAMRERYGYCEVCAKEAILFLVRKRYAG
jgi:RNA polymerase-binding transcription factor DksA